MQTSTPKHLNHLQRETGAALDLPGNAAFVIRVYLRTGSFISQKPGWWQTGLMCQCQKKIRSKRWQPKLASEGTWNAISECPSGWKGCDIITELSIINEGLSNRIHYDINVRKSLHLGSRSGGLRCFQSFSSFIVTSELQSRFLRHSNVQWSRLTDIYSKFFVISVIKSAKGMHWGHSTWHKTGPIQYLLSVSDII